MSEINIATKKILYWCEMKISNLDTNVKRLASAGPGKIESQDFYRQSKLLLDDLEKNRKQN